MTTRGSSLATVRDTPGASDADLVSEANDTIRRTVKALATYRDMGADEIASALGISRATAYRKLNGASEYVAGELAVLAPLFGCSVGDFYTGILGRPSVSAVPQLREVIESHTRGYPRASSRSRGALALVTSLKPRNQTVDPRNGSSPPLTRHDKDPDVAQWTKGVNYAHTA